MKDLKNYMEEMLNNLLKAEEQAFLKGIETNTIILNTEHAYVKDFYINVKSGIYDASLHSFPMIMGKTLMSAPLPDNYDFALTYSDKVEEKLNEEKLLELVKKYAHVARNGQLVFKCVSKLKNTNDYEFIKGMLKNDD